VAQRIAIDVSQLYSWPAKSGIQRTLLGLLKNWPMELLGAECVFEMNGVFHCVPVETVAQGLESRFFSERSDEEAEEVFRGSVWEAQTRRLSLDNIPAYFDGWLVPEPTWRPAAIDTLRYLQGMLVTGVILYDLIPELALDRSPAMSRGSRFSEFFRAAAQADICWSISHETRDDLVSRLRRSPTRPSPIITPGVDHVVSGHGRESTGLKFVCVGTLGPRKRTDLVVRAFAQASESGVPMALTLIGKRTPQAIGIVSEIKRVQSEGHRLEWLDAADDSTVWKELTSATASVVVGHEGYGIPAIESLAVGCPVISSRQVPSVVAFENRGVVILDEVTEGALADTFLYLSDPSVVDRLRAEITVEALPRWANFATGVALGFMLQLRSSLVLGLGAAGDGSSADELAGDPRRESSRSLEARAVESGEGADEVSWSGWKFSMRDALGAGPTTALAAVTATRIRVSSLESAPMAFAEGDYQPAHGGVSEPLAGHTHAILVAHD
jgi:glycosyltransferase involved in cell wall biosynthesis